MLAFSIALQTLARLQAPDAMKAHAITGLYLLCGFINFFPVLGVTGKARLEALYGASLSSPDIIMLMQHRALLFGVLGGIMLYAAFRPVYRGLAAVGGMISMVGYEILYLLGPNTSPALGKVALIDAVAILLLAVAIGLNFVPSISAAEE